MGTTELGSVVVEQEVRARKKTSSKMVLQLTDVTIQLKQVVIGRKFCAPREKARSIDSV